MSIKIENIKEDKDLEARKILLADEIIDFFTPLFNEEIKEKKSELEIKKKNYLNLKQKVVENDRQIETLQIQLKKELRIYKILKEIKYLVEKNVVYDRSKQLIQKLLLKLNTLDSKELDVVIAKIKQVSLNKKSQAI